MKAKYYTYRNLNFGQHFSVKHKGIVIDYYDVAMIEEGEFRVSKAGQQRCLRTKKRNVHAFIVSEKQPKLYFREDIPLLDSLTEVKYNPYRGHSFFEAKTGLPVKHAKEIYLVNGRCYVFEYK